MAFEDTLRSMRDFELGDLDIDNVGSWPVAIKVLIWALLLIGVLAAGYYWHVKDLQLNLVTEEIVVRDSEVTFERWPCVDCFTPLLYFLTETTKLKLELDSADRSVAKIAR